jgi:aminoglycoside phosphotransferase family enzyme/predicted kinase
MKRRNDSSQDTFQTFLDTLAQPAAFPPEAGVAPDDSVSIIQTHASAVLLTKTYAYKLKKPVNLEFLDYSTVERRRRFCIEECAINQDLAPDVYLGVAPVLAQSNGTPCFGPIFPWNQTPDPDGWIDAKQVIDFAVVMRRLPESRTLASLVNTGTANLDILRQVARAIAKFHLAAENGLPLAPFGTVETVLANIIQTLDQSKADIGLTISSDAHEAIQRYIIQFIEQRRELLESRLRAGWVRDCHGDLRLEHVYVMPQEAGANVKNASLLIVDRIEFDPRYRFGDVAGEVAFLVIELERVGRPDLARVFMRTYIEETGSKDLLEVLPLYQVYRAMVRGKVRSMLLRQPGIDTLAQAHIRAEAEEMYKLAAHHATSPIKPIIALIGGLMGTGKSTLAHTLREELGWPILSSDIYRKRMTGLPLTAPVSAADQESIYTADWDRRVYERLREEASARLAEGHSILLDATFALRMRRQMMTDLAHETGARIIFLECVCPRDTAISRLDVRWQAKAQLQDGGEDCDERNAIFASDGRPEIYDRQAQRWESYDPRVEQDLEHTIIDTTLPRSQQIEHALTALSIPRLTCWLD